MISNNKRPFVSIPTVSLMALVCFNGELAAQSSETLLDLRFTSFNPGDVANHPTITSITPWTNGSEIPADIFGFNYMPDENFDNGYAELTVPSPNFGFRWGFEGG